MWVFGSDCYTYKHDHKKLDPRGERGIFVGHSKNSPAYLIYNPHTEKVSKHRLVKFIKRNCIIEQQTQTEYDSEVQSYEAKIPSTENNTDMTHEENLSTDYTDESNVMKQQRM